MEDFPELSQISASLNVHQFDILCLTETFLNSSILPKDPRLSIKGGKRFCPDHGSNLF